MSDQKLNKNLLALLDNHQAGESRLDTVCLEGSTRSGKTWSWLEYAITCCVNMPGIVCTAFRHDASTHDKAAIRDFKGLMVSKFHGEWAAGKWNGTTKTFTFWTGSILEFCGTNDPMKLHGPERDIAFLNEVMEITLEAYRQILARTRLMVVMDWNPSLSSHWVFDRVLKRSDVLYVHSTYKDNPHLSDKQVAEIEATNPAVEENVRRGTADQWYWEVYGLGKRGRREGAIFDFVEIVDDWPNRMDCQRWGFGLDFGFVDPMALTECCLFQDQLWLRSWVYDSGLITCKSPANARTPSLQGKMEALQFQKSWKVCADQARKDSIAELASEGYNVVGVPKGPGSIVAGINLMKRFPIRVHRSSLKLQGEFEQYAWAKHVDGTPLDEPEDRWNHGIDGVRYWCMDELAGFSGSIRNNRRGVSRAAKKKKKFY